MSSAISMPLTRAGRYQDRSAAREMRSPSFGTSGMKPIHSSLISSPVSQPQVTVRGGTVGFCGLLAELSYRTQTSIRLPAGRWTGSR